MSLLKRFSLYLAILSLGYSPFNSFSAENESLPEVLTLELALKKASGDHPYLQIVRADVEGARAELLSVEVFSGLESRISGRLRWVDPPEIAYDQDQGDHKLSLFANKRLYDFGYSTSMHEAAKTGVASKEHLYRHALNKHRIAIMAAYFDVLLADLTNARDHEEMTVAYLQADKAKNRHELGMMSDIDLLELQSISQAKLVLFRRSGFLQYSTRTNLANILNTPGNPHADLESPELESNNRKIPDDVEGWASIVEKQNSLLLALQTKVLAANQHLASARGITNPVLTGQVEVSRYARESGRNDNWRAGITLDVPLKTSGQSKAAIAKYRAELLKARAELEQKRRQVRQMLLELLDELKTLHVERESVRTLMDYRDLYLDRSRAIYQMEVKSDLGDAEAKISDATLKVMRNKYAIALTWARIEALLGNAVYGDGGRELNNPVKQEGRP